jgi:bifunctional pyridoxal-dependent enzyme with beta-cystathionase and maltose regulon repressor activities
MQKQQATWKQRSLSNNNNFTYIQHIVSKLKGTHQNTSYQETSAANTCNWSNLPTWKNIRHQQPLLKFFIDQVCLENVKTTEKIHGRPKTTHWNYGIKSPLNQRRAYLQGLKTYFYSDVKKHSPRIQYKQKRYSYLVVTQFLDISKI